MLAMQKRMTKIANQFFSKINRKFSSGTQSDSSIWAQYLKLLEEKPFLTKCVTSGFVSFSADITCQLGFPDRSAEEKEKEGRSLDLWRVLKFTAIGSFFVGPVLHYWYGFLCVKIPGSTLSSTIQRVALDQLVLAPLFVPAFLSIVLILDGKTETIMEKLKSDWASTMLTNYTVWVPAMFINFKFVPAQLQVLFSNLVGFGWNIYLSNVSHHKPDHGESLTDAIVNDSKKL
jgi:hypothetical protein